MSDIMFIEHLKSFGLTGQEAMIYQVLLKNSEMTGYEVAKESGISRSNVYSALAALADKGAAYLIEGNPVRYVAVEIQAFCDATLLGLEEKAEYLKSHAPEPRETGEGYITIQGNRHIRNKMRDMLRHCEKRLYIVAEAEVITDFEKELQDLVKEGKKVVILTSGYELPGAILYQCQIETGQIRVIIDSSYVLTGAWTSSENDTCLYSGQDHLVAVMKEAIRNRITLIELNMED